MRRHLALGLTVATIALLVLLLPAAPVHASPAPVSAAVAVASVSPTAAPPSPFWTGMPASVVIGQANLTSVVSPTGPNQSNIIPDPELSCMDASGNLWVPNFGGGRVTEYLAPLTTDENASIEVGQPNFLTRDLSASQSSLDYAASCTFDSHGDLWVADFSGSRVLEFKPPFTNGMNASVVIGQSNYNSTGSAAGANGLYYPIDMAFDSQGNLYIADGRNNRVLEYQPPFATGMNATAVIGQTSFQGDQAGTTAANLTYPVALAYGNGILWVGDYYNDRVLGFQAPFVTGEGASYVLGATNFTTPGEGGLFGVSPFGVSVDNRGDLWVSDTDDNRVLEYIPPFSDNETPSIVIGQSSFAGTAPGISATNLSQPLGAFVSPTGDLIVSDGENDRVLEYIPTSYAVKFTETGLASPKGFNVTFAGAVESAPNTGISLSEVNGSYAWTVVAIAGYVVTPASGTLNLNGTGITVALTFSQVTYGVTFDALGLPSSASWTVTFGGVAHTESGGTAVVLSAANGSYSYSVTNVTGYTTTPDHGTVTVSGEPQEIGIGFFSTSSSGSSGTTSSSSSSGISPLVAVLLAVVGLIVGAVIGVLIGRRGSGKSSASPPPTAPATLPPPASAPASGPAAPWSESTPPASPGSGTPPPGAM